MQNSNYDHINLESDIYDYWEKNRFFKPQKTKKKYFSIVLLLKKSMLIPFLGSSVGRAVDC